VNWTLGRTLRIISQGPLLVRWGLRSPLQTGQIRIFSFGGVAPRGFFRLTENTFGLFFLPLLLELLFAVALG
jgi:hypothetical protein